MARIISLCSSSGPDVRDLHLRGGYRPPPGGSTRGPLSIPHIGREGIFIAFPWYAVCAKLDSGIGIPSFD